MEKEKVFWFNDGLCLNAPTQNWEEINVQSRKLISLIDNGERTHHVINPQLALISIKEFVDKTHPSVVVDLTGSLNNVISIPETEITSDFHISRLRRIDSPKIDGAGFLISHSQNELQKFLRLIDTSRPLIIDDVVWSGRTIVSVCDVLGLVKENTSIAAFCMNKGSFGKHQGGFGFLQEAGFTEIFSGFDVFTPKDDGFHTADLLKPGSVIDSSVFESIIRLQQFRELTLLHGQGTEDKQRECLHEITTVWKSDSNLILNSDQVKIMQSEGKIIVPGGVPKNALFSVNPPAWIMHSLSKRISSDVLKRNKDDIINAARSLNRFAENNETVREKSAEINAERNGGAERL